MTRQLTILVALAWPLWACGGATEGEADATAPAAPISAAAVARLPATAAVWPAAIAR